MTAGKWGPEGGGQVQQPCLPAPTPRAHRVRVRGPHSRTCQTPVHTWGDQGPRHPTRGKHQAESERAPGPWSPNLHLKPVPPLPLVREATRTDGMLTSCQHACTRPFCSEAQRTVPACPPCFQEILYDFISRNHFPRTSPSGPEPDACSRPAIAVGCSPWAMAGVGGQVGLQAVLLPPGSVPRPPQGQH